MSSNLFKRRQERQLSRSEVRRGLSPERRRELWYSLSGAQDLYRAGFYADLVVKTQERVSDASLLADFDAIEKDLHRTFPNDARFRPGGEMECHLRQILRCYAVAYPQVGYCQSMNFVCGLILHVYGTDEERCFWVMNGILTEWLPHVHDRNLEGVSMCQGILLLYIKQYCPMVYSRISYMEQANSLHEMLLHIPSILLPTTGWFMTLFVSCFERELTLKVWDNVLFEGPSSIYSVALEIVQQAAPHMGGGHPSDAFQLLQMAPGKVDTKHFIARAFATVGSARDLKAKRVRVQRARQELAAILQRRAGFLDEDTRRKELEDTLNAKAIVDSAGVHYARWRAKLRIRRKN